MATVAVVGPHSSGTRAHMSLVEEVTAGTDWEVLHCSIPNDIPKADKYIWVARDPLITSISMGRHGHGDWTTVWSAHAQWASFAYKLDPSQVMVAFYNDTGASPRTFQLRARNFLGLNDEPEWDRAFAFRDLDVKYLQEALLTQNRQL